MCLIVVAVDPRGQVHGRRVNGYTRTGADHVSALGGRDVHLALSARDRDDVTEGVVGRADGAIRQHGGFDDGGLTVIDARDEIMLDWKRKRTLPKEVRYQNKNNPLTAKAVNGGREKEVVQKKRSLYRGFVSICVRRKRSYRRRLIRHGSISQRVLSTWSAPGSS